MHIPSERVLTCCHDTRPFYAHIVDGVWVKSTPIKPNLPVGHNAYAVRNRVNSPDRIRHPMKRVDFDPDGERNPQNRGRSLFERISWEEALNIVAGELNRVREAYGASAICHSHVSHQWKGSLHRNTDWADRFFPLLGGAREPYPMGGDNGKPARKWYDIFSAHLVFSLGYVVQGAIEVRMSRASWYL